MIDTTISGAATPTALVKNSALPVQVNDRIPPSSTQAATSAAITITASEKDSGRNSEAISAANLSSATQQQRRRWKLEHARRHADVARAEAVAEKARQRVGAGLAQIRHEQHAGEQQPAGPAEPDRERVEAEKEHRAGIGEEADAADRDGRQHEAVEHGRHAAPRGEEILDMVVSAPRLQ